MNPNFSLHPFTRKHRRKSSIYIWLLQVTLWLFRPSPFYFKMFVEMSLLTENNKIVLVPSVVYDGVVVAFVMKPFFCVWISGMFVYILYARFLAFCETKTHQARRGRQRAFVKAKTTQTRKRQNKQKSKTKLNIYRRQTVWLFPWRRSVGLPVRVRVLLIVFGGGGDNRGNTVYLQNTQPRARGTNVYGWFDVATFAACVYLRISSAVHCGYIEGRRG